MQTEEGRFRVRIQRLNSAPVARTRTHPSPRRGSHPAIHQHCLLTRLPPSSSHESKLEAQTFCLRSSKCPWLSRPPLALLSHLAGPTLRLYSRIGSLHQLNTCTTTDDGSLHLHLSHSRYHHIWMDGCTRRHPATPISVVGRLLNSRSYIRCT